MRIANKKEVDKFIWEHRNNGCTGIKNGLRDESKLLLNTSWIDSVTREEINVIYEFTLSEVEELLESILHVDQYGSKVPHYQTVAAVRAVQKQIKAKVDDRS